MVPFIGNLFIAVYDYGRSQSINQGFIEVKKSTKDLIKTYVDKYGSIFMEHCTDEEKKDANFVEKAVLIDPENLKFASLEIKKNTHFFMAMMSMTLEISEERPCSICDYIHESLHDNIDFFHELAARNGECFKYFPKTLLSNFEILETALATYPKAITFFKGHISEEWVVGEHGLRYQPGIYPYLEASLQNSPNVQSILCKIEAGLFLLPQDFDKFEDIFIEEYVQKLEIEHLFLLMRDERLQDRFGILSNKKIMKACIVRNLDFIHFCHNDLKNDDLFVKECTENFINNFNQYQSSVCLSLTDSKASISLLEQPSNKKSNTRRRLSSGYLLDRLKTSVSKNELTSPSKNPNNKKRLAPSSSSFNSPQAPNKTKRDRILTPVTSPALPRRSNLKNHPGITSPTTGI